MPKRRSSVNLKLYDELQALQPKRVYEPDNAEGGADSNKSEGRADLPRDDEKKIEHMSPKTILFTQDTISYKFEDGRKLEETLASLKSGEITVESIPKITVIPTKNQGVYFARDNRRLCVFQKYEVFLDEKLLIPVIIGKPEDLGKTRLTAQTRSCGKLVQIVNMDFKFKGKEGGKKGGKVLETWDCQKT